MKMTRLRSQTGDESLLCDSKRLVDEHMARTGRQPNIRCCRAQKRKLYISVDMV
jgi:hypothetical protein